MRQSQLSAKLSTLLGQVGGNSGQVQNLFRRLSSLFFQGTDRIDPVKKRMLRDILVDLLPKVDIRVRRELAGQLYSMEHPPRELINLLIHDTIDVAGPLLEHAPLSDDDLIEVIENESVAHRSCISRRHHLTPAIKDALKRAEDAAVSQDELLQEKRSDTGLAETRRAGFQSTDSKTNVTSFVPPLKKHAQATGSNAPGIDAVHSTPPKIDIQEVVRSRRKYEDIARASVDWAWETGRTGEIVYLSDPAFNAFGRPAQTMTGFYLGNYCFPVDRNSPFQDFQEILDRRRPFRDLTIVTRDTIGRDRHWWLSGVPCFDLASGRFTGFRGTALEFRQETARENDEISGTAAQHADQQSSVVLCPEHADEKGNADTAILDKETATGLSAGAEKKAAEMLQTLSHEFRTPLNAILGFSEMIEHETWGPVSEPYQQQTKKILKSAHHLKNVVTDVLDAARIKAGKQAVSPRFFSLKQVVEASLQDVKRNIGELELNINLAGMAHDYTFLNDVEVFQKCLTKLLRAMFERALMNEDCLVKIKSSPENRAVIILPLMGAAVSITDSESTGKTGLHHNKDKTALEALGYPAMVAVDLAESIGCQVKTVWAGTRLSHVELMVSDFPADQTTPGF